MVRPKNSFVLSAQDVSNILGIRVTGVQDPPPEPKEEGECVIFYPGCSLKRLRHQWVDTILCEPSSEIDMGYYRVKIQNSTYNRATKMGLPIGWRPAPACLVVATALCTKLIDENRVECLEGEFNGNAGPRLFVWCHGQTPYAEFRLVIGIRIAIFQKV